MSKPKIVWGLSWQWSLYISSVESWADCKPHSRTAHTMNVNALAMLSLPLGMLLQILAQPCAASCKVHVTSWKTYHLMLVVQHLSTLVWSEHAPHLCSTHASGEDELSSKAAGWSCEYNTPCTTSTIRWELYMQHDQHLSDLPDLISINFNR